ncbi:hypothetical protein QZH41_013949 [Actinostola sp. cb2023]|nr:hypothetical protein QZH41_013949 [Actinostola sp. cb2023]
MAATTDLEVTSDAAGAVGYGAYYNGDWFNGRWSPCQLQYSIAYKELFPVVIAAHVWGHTWARQHVLFRSDNEAVVFILLSRTSRVPGIMRLVRSLLMAAAQFNFTFSAQHIPGIQNKVADALSRFHWQVFWQLVPKAREPLSTAERAEHDENEGPPGDQLDTDERLSRTLETMDAISSESSVHLLMRARANRPPVATQTHRVPRQTLAESVGSLSSSEYDEDDSLSVQASGDELNELVNEPPTTGGDSSKVNDTASDEVLKELEAAILEDDKLGPKIRQQLADIAIKCWGKKLPQDKITGLVEKHPMPENCVDIKVPRVNTEIWQTLDPAGRKSDLRLTNMQQNLQRATSAALTMCEKVLALKMENDVSKSILADGIDNIALLGHVGAELSCFRREQMKPGLKHDFRPLCSKELDEPSPLLFGDDLPKRIRDAKETTRIVVTVARDCGQKDRQSRGHRRPYYDNNHYQRTNGYSNGGKRQNFFGKGSKPGFKKRNHNKYQKDDAK